MGEAPAGSAALCVPEDHVEVAAVPRSPLRPRLLRRLSFDLRRIEQPCPSQVLALVVLEVPEEDSVDGKAVVLRQVLDDAIRGLVELGGDDRQLLVNVNDVRQRRVESIRERSIQLELVIDVLREGLLEIVEAQPSNPGAVVQGLGDDVAWGPVTLEFQDVDSTVAIERNSAIPLRTDEP